MRIAIVTATRAEFGLLTPLIRRIIEAADIELDLIVTGTHLSPKYGETVHFIEEEHFPIAHRIPILADGNTPYDISITMANTICRFAKCFREDRPDILVILGDRTEMLGVASAAMNERIPIAHLCGGSVTEGAVDDCVRHALTKMSYLHFPSTERYRQRIIQMGESPERVFNYGALSTENILKVPLFTENEIREKTGIPENIPYVVATFHPVTLEGSVEEQTGELIRAVENNKEYFYLFTMANADAGGEIVNSMLGGLVETASNVSLVSNLGMRAYLSAVKYATFVLGNSSSGVMEAPVLGTPTVNIGSRQKGRIMPNTVISCEPKCDSICDAIKIAGTMPHVQSSIFGEGNTSMEILRTIRRFLATGSIDLKKSFYDITIGGV